MKPSVRRLLILGALLLKGVLFVLVLGAVWLAFLKPRDGTAQPPSAPPAEAPARH